jgi:hypothetical protein
MEERVNSRCLWEVETMKECLVGRGSVRDFSSFRDFIFRMVKTKKTYDLFAVTTPFIYLAPLFWFVRHRAVEVICWKSRTTGSSINGAAALEKAMGMGS